MHRGGDAPAPDVDGGLWDAGDESAEPMPDYSEYIRTMQAEREWRRINSELWEVEVEAWAMAEAAAGRKFSVTTAIQKIRWRDRVDGQGQDVKVNDHWGPLWSRLLVKKHPELRPFVVQKRTPWDSPEIREAIA